MIPDTFFEYVWWATIKRAVKDLVFKFVTKEISISWQQNVYFSLRRTLCIDLCK